MRHASTHLGTDNGNALTTASVTHMVSIQSAHVLDTAMKQKIYSGGKKRGEK